MTSSKSLLKNILSFQNKLNIKKRDIIPLISSSCEARKTLKKEEMYPGIYISIMFWSRFTTLKTS